MADWNSWWANRAGQVGAATVSSIEPEPNYGAAVDVANANLNTRQYTSALNAIQTVTEDEAEQKSFMQRLKGFLGNVVDVFAAPGRAIAQDVGVVADDLAESAESGEGVAGAVNQDFAQIASTVGGGISAAASWVEEHLYQNAYQAVNALGVHSAIADNPWMELFNGATWAEAWELADGEVSFGQAWADYRVAGMDPERAREAYRAGFDDTGRPLDAAYRDIRENDLAYNVASGAMDFLKVWYADPLVIAGKAAGTTRALVKGDLDRMGARQSLRFRRVVTTPEADLDEMARRIKPWDVVGQRALTMAREKYELRNKLRSGEVDVVDLANTQAFAKDATGAHLLAEAAKKTHKDPSGATVLDDAGNPLYDDDTFDLTFAAMIGSGYAQARLADKHKDLSDNIRALTQTRMPVLDDAIRRHELRLDELPDTPSMTAFQRFERSMQAPNYSSWREAAEDAELAKGQLREYESYRTFLDRALNEAGAPGLFMVPRLGTRSLGQRIVDATSHVHRPSSTPNIVSTFTRYPIAAFLQRPGVVDLHRGNQAYESTARYFEQMALYGSKGLDATAKARGFDSWEALRRAYLSRMAASQTDTERRAITGVVEDIGFEAVARAHDLDDEVARRLAASVRGQRANLFTEIKRQAESRGYSEALRSDGKTIDTFTIKDGDHVREIELPVRVTQLDNYFIPTDLRALSSLLQRHGSEFRNAVGGGADAVEEVLRWYQAYWKPSVLFRLGYPIRTVSDEALRILALTQNFTHMLGQMPQAAAIGVANVPGRLWNAQARARNKVVANRWRERTPTNEDYLSLRGEGAAEVSFIDVQRKKAIEIATGGVERWMQDATKMIVNGRRVPKRPDIVAKLDKHVGAFDDRLAINPVTGAKVKANDVFDFNFGRAEVAEALDGADLASYMNRNSDLLSHPDAVLLVEKGDEGFTVTIGRRGPQYARLAPMIRQPGLAGRPITVAGQEFEAPFQPGSGDIYVPLNSSQAFWRSLHRTYEDNIGQLRSATLQARRTVKGDPDHAEAWADVLNRQFRPDPIVRQMVDGRSDDEIIDWLRTDPEGRALARRIPWRSHNPERWVEDLRQELNTYAPTPRLREKLLANEEITPEELQAILDSNTAPSPISVDELSVQLSTGRGAVAEMWGKFTDKGYHVLGTLPTDTLIRNPFFRMNYKNRLRTLTDDLPDDFEITPEARRAFERQAREYALKQTRRYLFSLADETELTHTLRFLSPFMGAWQESLTRWMTILMERPESFSRLWVNGWQDMDEAFFLEAVDENGLGKDDPDHGELTHIRMPIPESVKNALNSFVPGAGDVINTVKIDKRNLNTTLQGDPFWLPSGGPLVQFPAKYLLQNYPELADANSVSKFIYKYLFPTGLPRELALIAPAAWQQQFVRLLMNSDDPVFNNLTTMVAKQDYQNWLAAGGNPDTKPDIRESFEKAKMIQFFLVAGRLVSPASFQVEPESQFFIDMAHKIQAEHGHGREAMELFIREYGEDAWIWWTSSSRSNTGVPPTSEGFKAWKQYQEAIEDFPELGLAIVGVDATTGPFNYEVYARQRNLKVAPGDPRRQRETLGAGEAVARAESEEGWRRWMQWQTMLTAELAGRGLTSLQQSGAEDLQVANQYFRSQLFQELPGWEQDYNQWDAGRGYRIVDQMDALIQSGGAPKMAGGALRPDWQGVAEYIELHRMFGQELDARALAGGSRNIEAEVNEDLFIAWSYAIGDLVQRNPTFADIYSRFLERHTLTSGSG